MNTQSPLPLDPWMAASLMQKAVRRGEPELAARAAAAYHRLRGSMIWRRLVIIAFEDIGIGDADLVAEVTRLCTDVDVRSAAGSDADVISALVRRMAMAAKDRTADYFISAIKYHPAWEDHRAVVAPLSITERIRLAVDPDAPVPQRAVATWFASGVNGGGPKLVEVGDLYGLLNSFTELSVPPSIAAAVKSAVIRTKEPITLFQPLLWTLVDAGGSSRATDQSILPAPVCRGIPAWALDKHTASGKHAIGLFARENDEVRTVLEYHVPDFRARDVAFMAAFYADAIVLRRRLSWTGAELLERDGLEADMLKAGCPTESAMPIIAAVRDNLDHLNAIRCHVLGERRHNANRTVSTGRSS